MPAAVGKFICQDLESVAIVKDLTKVDLALEPGYFRFPSPSVKQCSLLFAKAQTF